MDVQHTDVSKRKAGAVLAAVGAIVLFAALIVIVLVANKTDPVPPIVLTLIIAVPAFVIIGVVIALLQRMKELKGGEYDDARKY